MHNDIFFLNRHQYAECRTSLQHTSLHFNDSESLIHNNLLLEHQHTMMTSFTALQQSNWWTNSFWFATDISYDILAST